MKKSNLSGIIALTVLLLVAGYFAFIFFLNPITKAGLTPKQVEQAIKKTSLNFRVTNQKTPSFSLSNKIPKSFWTPAILTLNPIEMYQFMGRHVYVIVLSREADSETGLIYVHDLSSTRGSEQFEGSFFNLKEITYQLFSYSN